MNTIKNILADGNNYNKTIVSTATYTVLSTDYILRVTRTSTGACTITIPTALITAGIPVLTIKDVGGNAGTNNITVNTEGAETIDGNASVILDVDNASINLYGDGTNLFIKDIDITSGGLNGYSYPFPRKTTIERGALTGMKKSAHVYDTDLNAVFYYNGSTWIQAY